MDLAAAKERVRQTLYSDLPLLFQERHNNNSNHDQLALPHQYQSFLPQFLQTNKPQFYAQNTSIGGEHEFFGSRNAEASTSLDLDAALDINQQHQQPMGMGLGFERSFQIQPQTQSPAQPQARPRHHTLDNLDNHPMRGLEASFDNGMDDYVGNSCDKKAFHNARERFRRKKLKVLYSDLRQLLPNPNPKKRLSIPNTVCKVLKYIPDLRVEIEKLTKQRDVLLALVRKKTAKQAHAHERMRGGPPSMTFGPCPYVTVSPALGRSEILVTIYTNREHGLQFSFIMMHLEESHLELLNASSFISQNKICYNLHLQVKAKLDTNLLQTRLLRLCGKSTCGM